MLGRAQPRLAQARGPARPRAQGRRRARLAADDDPRRLRRASRPPSTRARRRAWRTRSCARASRRCSTSSTLVPRAGDEPDADPSEPRGLLARLGGERGQSTAEFMGLLPVADRDRARALADRADSATRTCWPATRRARARASSRSTRPTRPKDQPYRDAAKRGPPEGVAQGREDRGRQGRPGDASTSSSSSRSCCPGSTSPFEVSDHASTSVEDDPLPPVADARRPRGEVVMRAPPRRVAARRRPS